MGQYKKIENTIEVTNIPWLLYLCSIPYFITRGTSFMWIMISIAWMSSGIENKNKNSSQEYPMLFISSILIGIIVFINGWLFTPIIFVKSVILGIMSIVGCWMWYGLDNPRTRKNDKSGREQDEHMNVGDASEVISYARIYLNRMKRAVNESSGEIYKLIQSIIERSEEIINEVSDSPDKKYKKARRFLVIYLKDISNIISTYHGLKYPDDKTTERFQKILKKTNNFLIHQGTKLDSDELFSLDVEMEVLNTLLEKHGV